MRTIANGFPAWINDGSGKAVVDGRISQILDTQLYKKLITVPTIKI